MQFPDDVELDEALANVDVTLDIRVEFDWNRNGLYDHEYSDLSKLVLPSYSISSSKIAGNLPEDLDVITGYSSAECKLSIRGQRKSDDVPMHLLFSPYLKTSPLYNVDIKGTSMRVHRIVYDQSGRQLTPIRQFTGWVRSFHVDVHGQSVKIVGSDIVDVNRHEVTLHNIAPTAGSLIHNDNLGPNGENSLDGVMSTEWAIEEALRQAGRPTGPQSQTDLADTLDIFYMSCNGSFLPSIGLFSGNLHDLGNSQVLFFPQRISSVYEDQAWQQGKYGLSPKPLDRVVPSMSGGAPLYESNVGAWRASDRVQVTENGSGAQPTYMTFSAWTYSNGLPVEGDNKPLSRINFFLDDVDDSTAQGFIDLVFYSDGQLDVGVYDDGNANPREWNLSGQQPEGWHYWYVILEFNTDYVAAEIRVDDTLVESSQITPGFNYSSSTIRFTRTNVINLYLHNPIQHIHIRAGFTQPTYDPAFKLPPERDGLPLAVNHGSATELTWIPNTYRRNPWDLLKELAKAEFGVVHTNEHGQVIYRPHRNVMNVTTDRFNESVVVNDDGILGMMVEPTIDQAIDTVLVSATQRRLQYTNATNDRRLAWSNDDPFEMYAPSGSRLLSRFVVVEDVAWIRVYPQIQDDTTEPFDVSECRAALVSDPTVEPAPEEWTWDLSAKDQVHKIQLFWAGLSAEIYAGCDHNNQEPAMHVWGATYGQRVRENFEYTNSELSSAVGRRVLTLPDNDWRQTEISVERLASDLLSQAALSRPVIENVKIRTDPRLQLLDVIRFRAKDTITGDLYAQVIGIERGSSEDSLSLRALGAAEDNDAIWNHEDRGWGVGEWVD